MKRATKKRTRNKKYQSYDVLKLLIALYPSDNIHTTPRELVEVIHDVLDGAWPDTKLFEPCHFYLSYNRWMSNDLVTDLTNMELAGLLSVCIDTSPVNTQFWLSIKPKCRNCLKTYWKKEVPPADLKLLRDLSCKLHKEIERRKKNEPPQ